MTRDLDPADLDWNDVRFFLAVVRARTIAKAAAALSVDQSTVGRRIATLESRLRTSLFVRSAIGHRVSAAGARVLESAERMEAAALELRGHAAGDEASITETVRVATTGSLAEAFIVPAVGVLRAKHPRIQVIVTTGFTRVDLRRGEADLAVRLVRATDPHLASRKLGDFAMRLYASRAYVAEHGMPTRLAGHALLAYEDALRTKTRHPFADLPMDGGDLALLSNSHRTLVVGATSGLGIAQLPSFVGAAHPELVRVFPDVEQPYSVWLVVPLANRRVAAIRAVTDAIVDAFKERRRLAR